jgi:hypothetical protein
MAHSTINIGNLATVATDHMMMVVAYAAFIQSR